MSQELLMFVIVMFIRACCYILIHICTFVFLLTAVAEEQARAKRRSEKELKSYRIQSEQQASSSRIRMGKKIKKRAHTRERGAVESKSRAETSQSSFHKSRSR